MGAGLEENRGGARRERQGEGRGGFWDANEVQDADFFDSHNLVRGVGGRGLWRRGCRRGARGLSAY